MKESTIDVIKRVIKESTGTIKGWKHAHSDLMKYRRDKANAARSVKLVRLNKDGKESGMHDAMTHYDSEEQARAKHADLVKLNPGRSIKHNLYVDGKHVGVLGEDDENKILSLLDQILEGRGRPRKDGSSAAEEDGADTHILMQLRKTITLRGQKPVKFQSGETYGLHPHHAYKALEKYTKMKKADDKEAFVHKLGQSRGSFFKAMQEEYEMIEESVDQSIHDHLTSKGFTKETSAGRVVYSHKKSGTHYSHSTLSHTWSQISKKRHDSGYVDIGKRQKIETIGNNDKMKQHLGIK